MFSLLIFFVLGALLGLLGLRLLNAWEQPLPISRPTSTSHRQHPRSG